MRIVIEIELIDHLLGPVPTKDMKTLMPTPFSFDPVFMDDAQCGVTNEKSIFQFLYSELS